MLPLTNHSLRLIVEPPVRRLALWLESLDIYPGLVSVDALIGGPSSMVDQKSGLHATLLPMDLEVREQCGVCPFWFKLCMMPFFRLAHHTVGGQTLRLLIHVNVLLLHCAFLAWMIPASFGIGCVRACGIT